MKVVFTLKFELESDDRHQLDLIEQELKENQDNMLFSLRQQAKHIYGTLNRVYPEQQADEWQHLHDVIDEARETGIDANLINQKVHYSEPNQNINRPFNDPEQLRSTATPEQIKETLEKRTQTRLTPKKAAPTKAKRTPGRPRKNDTNL
jgi:hypothetical protein